MTTADNQAPPKERRSSYRIETSFHGTVEGDNELGCRVVNLSHSGALAVSPQPIPEFSEVKIRLLITPEDHEAQELICQAAVVRCSQRADGRYDIGLFFKRARVLEQSFGERRELEQRWGRLEGYA